MLGTFDKRYSRGVPAPQVVFIFFDSPKKMNQKKELPAGGFFCVLLVVPFLNGSPWEFALRQTRCVFVAVAVGLSFWRRAEMIPLKG